MKINILHPLSEPNGSYLVVKRSPNSDAARFGLALQINSAALLASDSAFWQRNSVSLDLRFPDATSASAAPSTGLRFEKPLGSASQPLIFQASTNTFPFDVACFSWLNLRRHR